MANDGYISSQDGEAIIQALTYIGMLPSEESNTKPAEKSSVVNSEVVEPIFHGPRPGCEGTPPPHTMCNILWEAGVAGTQPEGNSPCLVDPDSMACILSSNN